MGDYAADERDEIPSIYGPALTFVDYTLSHVQIYVCFTAKLDRRAPIWIIRAVFG